MKKILQTLLKAIDLRIQKWTKRLNEQPTVTESVQSDVQHAYHSLSPLGDADPKGAYAQALRWALTNRRAADIKNIAITGAYGSGKSTILKTFQNNNKDLDLSFLNISLATFKEETENMHPQNGSDLLRLIELSILQQIFYREEDEKIPDSRFKKIKSLDSKKLKNLSIKLFLLVLATVQLFHKTFLEDIFGYQFHEIANIMLTALCLMIVVPGYYFIIYKSIRAISSLTISKLNFNNAEIEISDAVSKSILNNHLDEILYFFEVTDYSVVVIEDLDRFEQTEIFTKLRELNLLINSSKKIERDIAFVYAVRDDMFKDKDRTKFFDFIIPVIPVINSSNSNEKLMEIVKKNGYGINSELLENVSLFIDDMRLLYNITNEYHVYHKKLGNLNEDKLMSMVVYKNMFPNDFVALSNGEGELYTVFNKKEVFITEKLVEIDDQISKTREAIFHIDNIQIKDVHELRMLYVAKYVESLSNISSFRINNTAYRFSMVTEDDIFQAFIDDNAHYDHLHNEYSSYYNRNTGTKITQKFVDIEKLVDPGHSYQERLELIEGWNNDNIDKYKTKIAELEAKKNEIKHHKIRDIIALGGCKMDIENKKQLQLVNILLRNGYIDEGYLDYISIFYEGSITKADREFLLNVKAQIGTDFDYQLHKMDKLIPKIELIDFTQAYILNYSLVDFIFSKSKYKKQKDEILKIVSDESDISIEFLKGFLKASKDAGVFIKELVKRWPRIWQFFSQYSDVTKEKLAMILKLILENASNENIKAISFKSKLTVDISSMPDFLSSDVNDDKIKEVIKTLNVKFVRLNFDNAPGDLAKFVYQGHYYMLNEEMIRSIVKVNGRYDETDFNTRNYHALKESGCEALMVYIGEHISNYVSDVYLKMEGNTAEVESVLQDLLNNLQLSLELKQEIIDQVNTEIIDIKNIDDLEVAQLLLDSSAMVSTWNNVINYYHKADGIFDETLIAYLDDEDHVNVLSLVKIDKDNPVPNLETVKKFLVAMLGTDSISNKHYVQLSKSIPYYYNDFFFGDLHKEKVKALITHKVLGPSVANYSLLKSQFPDLHILLAEHWHVKFFEKLETFELGEPEVFAIISSDVFTIAQKNKLIDHVEELLITGSDRTAAAIGALRIIHDDLQVPKVIILQSLYSNGLKVASTVKLLNKSIDILSKDEITSVLEVLPDRYSNISILGRRPKLEGSQDNWELANKLVAAEYIKGISDEKGDIRISTFRGSVN